MIRALHLELEPVRVVLKNPVNEVSVCADSGHKDSFYTVISILSKAVAKELAARVALGGLFSQNSDFVGHLSHRDALLLIFRYHSENRLANKQALYAKSFGERKALAVSLLTALAGADFPADIGLLLIAEENLNIAADGKVYLNYLLDFSRFSPSATGDDLYRAAAGAAFDILAAGYAAKYERHVEYYPHELRLMYKKIENRTFHSYSQAMTFVQALPDTPREQRFGAKRLLGAAERLRDIILRKPANLFLSAVVAITLVYLGYQLAIRAAAGRGVRENTVFVGLQTIGEVYLGEEDI